MRFELKARELNKILCAKSVGMTFGGDLHRDNILVAFTD